MRRCALFLGCLWKILIKKLIRAICIGLSLRYLIKELFIMNNTEKVGSKESVAGDLVINPLEAYTLLGCI